MKIEEVLIKPVLTEKATENATHKIYFFEVHHDANKYQVKDAVKQLFKVKVGEVRMMTRKGKSRKSGKRMMPKKLQDRKIALVQVIEGKIDLFPQP